MFVNVMKTVAVVTLIVTLSGCVWSDGFTAQKTVTRSAEYLDDTPLVVNTRNGAVKVTASPEYDEIVVEAKLKCKGATQGEADRRLAAAGLMIARGTDRTLRIEAQFPEPTKGGDGASMTVHLPSANGIEVYTSNGSVAVKNCAGRLFVDTSNGSVTVTGHRGEVIIDTSNGGVKVVTLEGPATIDTSNGSITVELAGDAVGPVNADTSNGNITLTAGPGFDGQVRMDTSNGSVTVDDDHGRVTKTSISKSEGMVTVGGEGPDSRLDTSNGAIRLVLEPSG